MRSYEIIFIVNPNVAEEEIDKIKGQLHSIITSGGGTVEKIEKMGKRGLAYEVDKHREGYYVMFVITANGDIVKECERRLLRHREIYAERIMDDADCPKPDGWRGWLFHRKTLSDS